MEVSNSRGDVVASAPFSFQPVTVAPDSIKTDDVLTTQLPGLLATSTGYAYQWYKNGVALAGATAGTLDLGAAGNGSKGDSIMVRVTPSDGTLAGVAFASVPVVVADDTAPPGAGFETPPVGAGTFGAFQYDPAGSAWAFVGAAGISGNGSGFTSGNPDAPEGAQVAFLQGDGSFSQSVSGWAAGTYRIGFQAAQRGNRQAAYQDFDVLVDGEVVATVTPAGTDYATYTTAAFGVSAGTHTITFRGRNTAGGDNTAFLDDIQVVTG